MHGDIFIYYKFLFYLLSLINDISEFGSDQITFLYTGYRPTYCMTASISHLQTFSVHGRTANEPKSTNFRVFCVQVHAISWLWTDWVYLCIVLHHYVNVAFLLTMSLLVFLDALEDFNHKVTFLWVRPFVMRIMNASW